MQGNLTELQKQTESRRRATLRLARESWTSNHQRVQLTKQIEAVKESVVENYRRDKRSKSFKIN